MIFREPFAFLGYCQLIAWRIGQWLNWYARAGNAHGLHSPFVFALYNEVINRKNYSPSKALISQHQNIEALRKSIASDSYTIIKVTDFGTGGKNNQFRSLSLEALSKMATPKKQGRFLYLLVKYLKPKIVLELGTNIGLGTAYFASGLEIGSLITTVEGCPNVAKQARNNFQKLGLNSICQEVGNLNTILKKIVDKENSLCLVYFDANHAYEPTLKYFTLCLEKVNEQSVFLFDDLRYSPEMMKAWTEIKQHKKVTVTIDMFDQGLVFFKADQAKQHFYLKP